MRYLIIGLLLFCFTGCNLTNKPKTSEEYTDRALKEMSENDYGAADSDFSMALVLKADNMVALFGLSLVKKLEKDYKVALKFSTIGIQSNPLFRGRFLNLRGEIRREMGDKDSACIDFNAAGNLGDTTAFSNLNKYCR